MPLLNLVAVNIVGWGYLIKMHSYMSPQLNICRMSQYTIGDNSNLKHSVTKSMVGPLPLALHHDYLQYMYHVYVMQMGSKPGCYRICYKITPMSPFYHHDVSPTLIGNSRNPLLDMLLVLFLGG